MDSERMTDVVNTDVDTYLKKQSEEALWNLSLHDTQAFPIKLGAGNVVYTPDSAQPTSDFSDDPEGVHQDPAPNQGKTPVAIGRYSESNLKGMLSPNLNHGAPFKQPCDTIVLHWTGGGSAQGAISTLIDRRLSYHAIVERSGNIIQCVPFENKAYHAGVSSGPNGPSVNSYSIGISFVNLGGERGDYPDTQRFAAYKLINSLRQTHPLKWITGHVFVAPTRKRDPIDFPFDEAVAQTGLRFWRPSTYIRPARYISTKL